MDVTVSGLFRMIKYLEQSLRIISLNLRLDGIQGALIGVNHLKYRRFVLQADISPHRWVARCDS